jgi:hypothetical protein
MIQLQVYAMVARVAEKVMVRLPALAQLAKVMTVVVILPGTGQREEAVAQGGKADLRPGVVPQL